MAIIGSAEVEVRADVRKLGRDIKDSFNDLSKTADDIADKMGKSIGDSLKKNLDGLTIKVNIDDSIRDDIIEIEEHIDRISNQKIKINLDDSDMARLNSYRGRTLRYDVDLDTTYLDSQLARIADQKIDLKVDNRSLNKVKTEVESTVAGIPESSRTVSVVPDIDGTARNFLNDKMKEVMADVQKVADKHAEPINLDVDVSQVEEHLEMLREYEEEDLKLGITLDDSDLETVNAALEALRQYNEANAIDLHVQVHIAEAMAKLALLTRKRFVEIVPRINKRAVAAAQGVLAGFTGFNIMKEHTEDFIRSLTELDKQLPQTAMVLSILSAAVPTAGWGAGVLSMLIGDLAALSGLAVPGAAALVAVGGGMFFLTNAFAQENKKKYIPQVTAQFEKLSDTIAGDFWKVAKPSYTDFAFNTLPAIYNATKGVNTGTAELTSSLLDSIGAVLETGRGMSNLQEISGNVEKAMGNLSGAFEPAIQGILTFVRSGSKYLPELGTYITDLAEQFDSWMQTLDESGALDEWVESAVSSLKALGSIVLSVIGIFYSLYQAAKQVGFPGLTEIASGLESINTALAGEGAQTKLVALGTAFKGAFDQMAQSLWWVGPVISNNIDNIISIVEIMGDIVSEIFLGLGDVILETGLIDSVVGLFESFRTAVEIFRPAFMSIGTILAVTFDFIGAALENITPVLTQFFYNLEQDAVLIKPAMMGMLDIIGEWGPKVMEVFGHVTNAAAEWFGNLDPMLALAGLAFVGLGGIVTSIGAVILGAIKWVGDFGDDLYKLLGVFGKAVPEGQLLQTAMSGLGQAFKPLGGAVRLLSGPFGWIIGAFISAFMASEDLRKAVGEFLGNAFKTLLAFIMPLIGPIGELFGALMSGVDQIGAAVAPAFTGLFNAMNSIMPIIQLVAHILGVVLAAAIKAVVPMIKNLFSSIANVVGGLADILGGAFNAIAAIFEGVVGVIKGLVSGDMGAVKDALMGMWDGLVGAWGQIWSGIIDTLVGVIDSAISAVTTAIQGILEGILSVLQAFDLWDQGQAIIQGLIDGFQGMLDTIRQWLQDLTQKIVEWKGPPSTDATLLTDAGRSIIQSLIDGFISVVQDVFTFLQELTQRIVDVVMGVVDVVVGFFQTGWGVLVTVVQTVWNLIVTVIQTVLTTIMTVVQTYINIVVTLVQTGWNILVTIVQAVWTGIQTVIQAAWSIIQIIIQTALTVVVTIFTTVWNTVLTVVTTVWTMITTSIQLAITTVMMIIQTVLNTIMTIITTVWNTIKTVTMTVWNAIKALIQLGLAAIQAIFTGNFAAFRAIIQTAWNVIKSTTQIVWNTIKSAISSVINAIRSTITSVFNAIRSTVTSIMNGIRSTIQSVWSAIRSAISSAVNTVRSVVTSAFNAVRSIITSVMNSARSIVSSVWSSIRSTISSAVSGVRSTVSSGFNALRSIVTSAWNAVVSAIRSAISRMMSLVRGIPGQIRGALGNLGSLLTGAGRSIIQGLINGVNGMIGSLKNKFSSITNMIPDWKGPPDTDAHLLTNAGELIMQGLIEGLESKYGAVKNSLQTFTGDLSQTVGTQIGADIGVTTSVRQTALSEAERRLSYRSGDDSMVQSNNGEGVHIHFHQAFVNTDEVIMAVNRELGRG